MVKNALFGLFGLVLLMSIGVVSALVPVDLGASQNFSIVAQTGISDASPSTSFITGDIAIDPSAGSLITGVSCTNVNGTIFDNNAGYTGGYDANTSCLVTDAVMTLDVQSAMVVAYNDARDRINPNATELNSGNLGGLTLTSGLYKWSTPVSIADDVILDCQGDADAVFIFQGSTTLGLSSGKSVNLTGGCQAGNIFWQFDTAVTLGTYSTFEGTILSGTAITVMTGATVNGRLFGQTAVTLDSNQITLPILSTPIICTEDWISNDTVCDLSHNRIIQYYDANSCGTNASLPVDNGSIAVCPFIYSVYVSLYGVDLSYGGNYNVQYLTDGLSVPMIVKSDTNYVPTTLDCQIYNGNWSIGSVGGLGCGGLNDGHCISENPNTFDLINGSNVFYFDCLDVAYNLTENFTFTINYLDFTNLVVNNTVIITQGVAGSYSAGTGGSVAVSPLTTNIISVESDNTSIWTRLWNWIKGLFRR